MDFTPPDSQTRKPVTPPPNYFARAVQLRLLTAVGALMLVLVLMMEARQPENWAWMWGGTLTEEELQVDTSLDSFDDVAAQDAPGTVYGVRSGPTIPPRNAARGGPPSTVDLQTQLERAAWESVLEALTHDQRFAFEGILLQARRETLRNLPDTTAWASAFTAVQEAWMGYLAAVRSSVANGDFSADERRVWQSAEAWLTTRWQNELQPALRAPLEDRPWIAAEREAIAALQSTVDAWSLSQVEDNTVSRPREQYIWFRLMEELQASSPDKLRQQSVGPVSFVQLFRQPDDYRAELVTVQGVARLGYRVSAPPNLHGIEHYQILWVKPASGQLSPFLVYCLELPPEFPPMTQGERVELRETVEVTGFFLKRQAYRALDGVNTTPLILARTVDWTPPALTVATPIPNPVVAAITLLFVCGLAGLISWVVYRSTSQIAIETQMMVPPDQQVLSGLSDRDRGSVGQKLQQLAERDQSST